MQPDGGCIYGELLFWVREIVLQNGVVIIKTAQLLRVCRKNNPITRSRTGEIPSYLVELNGNPAE